MKKILLVDDEKGVVAMMKSYFEMSGYHHRRGAFGGDCEMKSYLALAWKELKAQKITAVLILIAVITSTIMTTVIGQSIGILQSMRVQQAAGLNGNRYVTFHQLGREQTQKLHEDDRLYDVGDIIFVGSTTLGNSSLTLYLREYHDNALAMYPAISEIKEGRLPKKANEVALSEDALHDLGLDAAIGDTISLDLSVYVMDGSLPEVEYVADFTLTGILENSYLGYATGTVVGIVGNGTAESVLPDEYLLYSTDFKTHSKQDFQSIVCDLAAKLQEDDRYIQYNWVLLHALGIAYDADEDTRVGEIGMQRAIGMSAASLYKTFLWEGAYYAIFASVIGAVLGYVCCIFVGAAKTDTLQLVTVPVMAIIEVAVVSVAACLLATAIPLRSIAKMNIVESIENVE